jgi:8-oxo-dGTP diphosphatase
MTVMSSSAPLYERDPAAYEEYLRQGNATQARKRVGADALIRDAGGRVLLVDPGYKPGWDLPGGMCEANEPPAACVRRELQEELDLVVALGPMLVADWVPPHGPWDDLMAFVFDGGLLSRGQVASIRLLDGELERYKMFDPTEAIAALRPRASRRLAAALAAAGTGQARYLQDGQPV